MAKSLEFPTLPRPGSLSLPKKWVLFLAICIGLGNPSIVSAKTPDPAIVAQITSARAAADRAMAEDDYRSAEVAFSLALTLTKTLVPDNHLHIAIGMNNVAIMALAQGDVARAKPLFIDVLTRIERLGLSNAPIGFTARENLIQTLMGLGQLRQAQDLALTNLASRKRTMPLDAATIGSSVNILMLIYIQQGAYDDAEQAYQQAAIVVPSDVPETEIVRAQLLTNLALVFLSQEKFSQAHRTSQDAIRLFRRYLPAGHPDTAMALNNFSNILAAEGKYNEALVLQREVFASLVVTLGVDHNDSIGVLANIALSEERLGQTDQANATAREVVARRRAQRPISPPDLAKALSNLAVPLVGGINSSEAIQLLEEARTLILSSQPTNHPDALAYTNNLAFAVLRGGNAGRAIHLYREAIAGWANRPEKWHSVKATSQTSLVVSLIDIGARGEAYSLQRQVGIDLLDNYGARAGIDLESQREFRKWQWVFRRQMQLGWFAAHANMPVQPKVFRQ